MIYTCRNNDITKPDVQWVRAGWQPAELEDDITIVPVMKEITSPWLPIACGHSDRATDPGCEGCHRRD